MCASLDCISAIHGPIASLMVARGQNVCVFDVRPITGIPCRAKTLATSLGYIQCASFSSDSQFVALGHGCEVLVYQVKVCELGHRLLSFVGSGVVWSRHAPHSKYSANCASLM